MEQQGTQLIRKKMKKLIKYKLVNILLIFTIWGGFIVAFTACDNNNHTGVRIFHCKTLKGVTVKMIYENGELVAVRQLNDKRDKNVLTSFSFNKDGTLSGIRRNLGDSLLEIIIFYRPQIEFISYDKDLYAYDTVSISHGKTRLYYENGVLEREHTFFNGKLKDTIKEFDTLGNLIYQRIIEH
jgi:antitoxin component YwqK of YwqJK toxin-antitoxin module